MKKKAEAGHTTINVGGANSVNTVTTARDVHVGQLNVRWPFQRKVTKEALSGQTAHVPEQQTRLFETLRTRFSLEEIENLCYEMGIASDELPAHTRSGKARQLVEAAAARTALDKLDSMIKRERPE